MSDAACLNTHAEGLPFEGVEVKDFKITGDVCVENTVTVEAEDALPCHLCEDSAVRVVTDEVPLQVKVVNDRDEAVPIEDVHGTDT